ncbi:hypothetical protein OE88DRAFT_1661122 [Heliocybe sulcata]|uniref:Uncharacterized protein n=1 Tax=Heliocybe sulcata TaxID=5364 RepID=A0A5C3N3D2_9AGAM|nr:hypothetical protein OE88DRAFT_1661122 [Heliocybe sulcata]
MRFTSLIAIAVCLFSVVHAEPVFRAPYTRVAARQPAPSGEIKLRPDPVAHLTSRILGLKWREYAIRGIPARSESMEAISKIGYPEMY